MAECVQISASSLSLYLPIGSILLFLISSTEGVGDPWKISSEERAKHDAQFFQLKPVCGFLTGLYSSL